jgi:hypothetical protein
MSTVGFARSRLQLSANMKPILVNVPTSRWDYTRIDRWNHLVEAFSTATTAGKLRLAVKLATFSTEKLASTSDSILARTSTLTLATQSLMDTTKTTTWIVVHTSIAHRTENIRFCVKMDKPSTETNAFRSGMSSLVRKIQTV